MVVYDVIHCWLSMQLYRIPKEEGDVEWFLLEIATFIVTSAQRGKEKVVRNYMYVTTKCCRLIGNWVISISSYFFKFFINY